MMPLEQCITKVFIDVSVYRLNSFLSPFLSLASSWSDAHLRTTASKNVATNCGDETSTTAKASRKSLTELSNWNRKRGKQRFMICLGTKLVRIIRPFYTHILTPFSCMKSGDIAQNLPAMRRASSTVWRWRLESQMLEQKVRRVPTVAMRLHCLRSLTFRWSQPRLRECAWRLDQAHRRWKDVGDADWRPH